MKEFISYYIHKYSTNYIYIVRDTILLVWWVHDYGLFGIVPFTLWFLVGFLVSYYIYITTPHL